MAVAISLTVAPSVPAAERADVVIGLAADLASGEDVRITGWRVGSRGEIVAEVAELPPAVIVERIERQFPSLRFAIQGTRTIRRPD